MTGGAGFIGSVLTRRLVARGDAVTVADNLTATHSLRLLAGIERDITFVHLDVRCSEDFARLPRGPWDVIFHLAASFANALSVEHPLLDARTNVDGTRNVIAHAARAGCGLMVYTGSSSSYGDAPLPHHEDGLMHPATPYARSKLEAESLVRAAGVPHAIFRLFNVYGPGDPPNPYRNAIPNMMKALDAPEGHILLTGEGATRDFTYIDDAIRVLAQPEPATGRTVNVATGVDQPISEVARAILALFDLPENRVITVARRAWDQVIERRADVSRLRELYGDVPNQPLADGLRETARWLSAEGYIARSVV